MPLGFAALLAKNFSYSSPIPFIFISNLTLIQLASNSYSIHIFVLLIIDRCTIVVRYIMGQQWDNDGTTTRGKLELVLYCLWTTYEF